MKVGEHGFDYDSHGQRYASTRRTDPGLAGRIHDALGDSRAVLNVGAGAGSYEPTDRDVVAVEPSAVMRSLRTANGPPVVAAVAEWLPFGDQTFDAAMAILTVHHWSDRPAGLLELRRVTRGPIVILTCDPDAETEFWLSEYAPEIAAVERERYGPFGALSDSLVGRVEISPVSVASDCVDLFQAALFARPEFFLDERVRASQSAWSHLPIGVEERIVRSLTDDLKSGEWDRRYGHFRTRGEIQTQLRLIVAHRG
jgi:SAM-dependent methyltransferase